MSGSVQKLPPIGEAYSGYEKRTLAFLDQNAKVNSDVHRLATTPETARTARKAGAGVGQRTFAGHEYDVGTGLSYMGARYYDGNLGRFLSEDPMFLAIGTDLRKYGKMQDEILADPQQMNAYSYARNNPLVYVDNTGQASTLAWMMNPIGTAAQVMLWSLGSFGLKTFPQMVGGSSFQASSAFMQHSLSLNPGSISINRDNQSSYGNIVDQITDSKAYNDATSRFVATAESKGLTSANSSNFNDGFEQSVAFTNGDLFASIGKVTNFHVEGNKDANGTWNLNVNMKDTYNFESGGYNSKAFGTLNNAAVVSQQAQAISPYSVNIDISSTRKKRSP